MELWFLEEIIMQISKFLCFGSNKHTGNLAYVIVDDNMSHSQRQEFAKQSNTPVCIFIDKTINNITTVSFYYPNKISPLCLHGALAVAQMTFTNNPQLTEFTIESSFGKQVIAKCNDWKISLIL